MGVRGLETFMEKNSNAACPTHIRKIMHDFRKEYKCTPVIVIDGMSIMRFVYKLLNLSWIFGGQIKEYEETFKEFIQNFLKEGAELVFYFDGPCVTSKRGTWIKRRLDKLQAVYSVMDGLTAGNSVQEYESRENQAFILPSGLKTITVYIAKKYGCKVHTSVRECDLEIAEYADRNQCMAILAQDSDYVIFCAAKYYLSMKNFNLHKMTTLNYNSFKLASFLGISKDHLPLFASLLGNDIITIEELKEFHSRMLKRRGKYLGKWIDFRILFTEVAHFVRSFPSGFYLPNDILELIAHKVFSDSSKAPLIRESLQSYNLKADQNKESDPPTSTDQNWNAVLRRTWELNKDADIPSAIYSIIVLQEYRCATCFEDYRLDDIPASQTAIKPLRQKMYGILLHEKPRTTDVCEVNEMVMCSENSLDEPVCVKALKPNVHHPGLLALWSNRAIEESWALIGDIFDIDPRQIKTLPAHLIIPALTIRYLNDRVQIERWELRALISSAVLVQVYNAQYLSQIKLSGILQSTRPLRLFTLVTRSYSTTQMIFQSVGNPITDMIQPTNYQDGKLFNLKYNEAQHVNNDLALCDRKEAPHGYFALLLDFILASDKVKM